MAIAPRQGEADQARVPDASLASALLLQSLTDAGLATEEPKAEDEALTLETADLGVFEKEGSAPTGLVFTPAIVPPQSGQADPSELKAQPSGPTITSLKPVAVPAELKLTGIPQSSSPDLQTDPQTDLTTELDAGRESGRSEATQAGINGRASQRSTFEPSAEVAGTKVQTATLPAGLDSLKVTGIIRPASVTPQGTADQVAPAVTQTAVATAAAAISTPSAVLATATATPTVRPLRTDKAASTGLARSAASVTGTGTPETDPASRPASSLTTRLDPFRVPTLAKAGDGEPSSLAGETADTDAFEAVSNDTTLPATAQSAAPLRDTTLMPAGTTGSNLSAVTAHTISQLSQTFTDRIKSQETRFDIELEPHGLGKVRVELSIDAAGNLTAAMNFEQARTASELKARSEDLRSALQSAGFELSQSSLSFDMSGGGQERPGSEMTWRDPQNGSGQQDAREPARAFEAALLNASQSETALLSNPYLSNRPSGGIDVRI